MTQWQEPCRWVLIAALAVQLSGCAQTSQWVSRWTGRSQDDEKLAEIDGRDAEKPSGKRKEKVKVASSDDAAKKRSKKASDQDDPIAARSKSKRPSDSAIADAEKEKRSPKDPFREESPLKRGLRRQAGEELAAADSKAPRRRLAAPLGEKVAALDDEEDLDKDEDESSIKVASQKTPKKQHTSETEADVREAAHLSRLDVPEPEWAREDAPVAAREKRRIPDLETENAVTASDPNEAPAEKESVVKKLATLKPSQASYLQLCPAAEGDVRELVRGLDDADLEHVRRSIHRLGRLGTEASASLPALEQLLRHHDGNVRIHAALAMCRIDGVSPAVLDTLITELKSDDPGRRSFAAAVIAELGPAAGDAAPALAEALEDRDPYVRLHVAEVLIRCDDWSEKALDALLDCLNDRDENIRWLATYSLAELAPQSENAVKSLAKVLADNSTKVRIGAVYALGEIGQLSRPVARDLRRLDHDPNPEIRSAVAYALEQIESPADSERK
jgi:HEAT repeat protein